MQKMTKIWSKPLGKNVQMQIVKSCLLKKPHFHLWGDLKEKKVKQLLGEPCWEKEHKLSLIDVLVQRAEKWQSRKPPWECS